MVFSKDLTNLIYLDEYTGNIASPDLILMTKDFNIIGKISNYYNWQASIQGNSIDEFTFDIAKYINGELNPLWDKIIDLKVVEIKKYGRFEISITYTDNTKTVKTVHGYSLETELAQLMLHEFHVNDDDATSMKITDYNSEDFDKDGNFIPTTFYNPDDERHSLLHRVLADKAPHWSVGYVTPYISLDDDYVVEPSKTFQRTFTADGTSIYDFLTQDVAKEANVVFIFDTIHRIINCYSLSDGIDKDGNIIQIAIGEDTNICLSKDKIVQEISLESNKDNIKNCLRVQGGDDTITSTVAALNVTGSNYIYKFDNFQLQDMPQELVSKLEDYQNEIKQRTPEYQATLTKLYKAYERLSELQSSMMPGNAEESTDKWIKKTSQEMYNDIKQKLIQNKVGISSLKSISNISFTALNNNVEAMAKAYGDSRFTIELIKNKCTYDSKTTTWTGNILVTKVDDETDYYPKTDEQKDSTFSILIEDDTNNALFTKQKIERMLDKDGILDIDDDIYNILKKDTEITEDEKDKIQKYFNQYCLNRLKSFRDGYDSCLSILQEAQLVSTEAEKNYIYERYYTVYNIVSNIYDKRETEVNDQESLISSIQSEQAEIQSGLDLKGYLGNELYNILCMYRREDTYENSNYVSDNLTDSEVFQKSQELLEVAKKELNKSCVIQRTVSSTLKNLFALNDFKNLWEHFQLYNYIRIRTEDELLKLRIVGFEVSGDSISDMSVTFADKIESIDGKFNDTKSILEQAKSISTSYNSTVLQAKQGSNAQNKLLDIYNNGLNAASAMIKNDTSETFTITSAGAIAKRMDDVGFYGDKQLRITGNMIAMTKDNWQTVSMALGETEFINPNTGEVSNGYGVIAENIIGKMMLTENLYISNEKGNIRIDGNGITLSGKQAINWNCDDKDVPINETIKEYCLIWQGAKPTDDTEWSTTLPIWIENKYIWSRIKYVYASGVVEYGEPVKEDGLSKTYINFGDFQNSVKNNLYNGTEITQDSIISPKIGGGYAYFTNGDYSVEIDPNHQAGDNTLDNYLFCIRQNATPIMGVDTSGNGYFKGRITGEKLEFYYANSNNVLEKYGQLDIGRNKLNDINYYGIGVMVDGQGTIQEDSSHRRIVFGMNEVGLSTVSEGIYFNKNENDYWESYHEIYIPYHFVSAGLEDYIGINFIKGTSGAVFNDNGLRFKYYTNNSDDGTDIMCIGKDLIRLNSPSIRFLNNKGIQTYTSGNLEVRLAYWTGSDNIFIGDYRADPSRSDYDSRRIAKTVYLMGNNVSKVGSGGMASLSDARYKTNVTEIPNAKEFIMNLQPRQYKFTDGGSNRNHFGFIAQDVEKCMADTTGDAGVIVKYNFQNDENDKIDYSDDSTYYYGLRYEELIAPLVQTVQEQQNQINTLIEELKELKGDNKNNG